MRSASFRPFFLLLSAAAAFGVLAWSAQHGPHLRPPLFATVALSPGSNAVYTYDPAGSGFFGRMPPANATVVTGVDSVTLMGRSAVCMTVTWSRGTPPRASMTPCRYTP